MWTQNKTFPVPRSLFLCSYHEKQNGGGRGPERHARGTSPERAAKGYQPRVPPNPTPPHTRIARHRAVTSRRIRQTISGSLGACACACICSCLGRPSSGLGCPRGIRVPPWKLRGGVPVVAKKRFCAREIAHVTRRVLAREALLQQRQQRGEQGSRRMHQLVRQESARRPQ